MSLVFTSALHKSLPTLTATTSPQNWEKIAIDFIGQKQNETLALINRVVRSIQILEQQKEKASALISILEEGGGLTVRARNMMTTPADALKYADKIKEFENWYDLVRAKFDKTALESVTDGVNLMNGDRLETLFDAKGQNKLVTEGLVLSCEALGIRKPDFSENFQLQNARIDMMNAIDIVVTIRNTISAHISDLLISQELALNAIELAKESIDKLGTSSIITELLGFKKLSDLGDKILGDDKMAEPAQQEILDSFASSPNMEGI